MPGILKVNHFLMTESLKVGNESCKNHKVMFFSKTLICKNNWKLRKSQEFCIGNFVNFYSGLKFPKLLKLNS
jgi:hypothetical protein